jgi:hypothetical protein
MDRAPVAHLGAMRAARWLGNLGSALCVSVCTIVLWTALRHKGLDLLPLASMYVGGVLLALGARRKLAAGSRRPRF